MRYHERAKGLLRSPWLLSRLAVRGRYDFRYDEMPISARRMSLAKRWNLFKSGLNLVQRRLKPWAMPLHMQFELTNYCQLRCPVCPTGIRSLPRPSGSMDVDLFASVMKDVGPYLLTASLWGWGEPLLHPSLREILRITQGYPATFLLSTNGQNLDNEEIISALIEYPPTHLIVALDGLTDATNSRYRVGARLEPALEGVRLLKEIKKRRGLTLPILHMRYMVMEHNQHELPELEDFARTHHFDLLTLRTLSIIDSDPTLPVHRVYLPQIDEYRPYKYSGTQRTQESGFVCMQPFWFPSVFADGKVAACEQDFKAQHLLGAVESGRTFKDVWYGPEAVAQRKAIRELRQRDGFCRNCPFSDRQVTDASVRGVLLDQSTPHPVIVGG